MKAEVSLREIQRIIDMGVKFEYGSELGRNVKIEDLAQKYDAVFLGMGLGADSRMDVPGARLPQIHGAVDFIARMKTLPASQIPDPRQMGAALVVGGGNTALDACRELIALGVKRVIVSYRRGEKEMSGYAHEFRWARQEGVEFRFHTVPAEFKAAPDGRVTAKLQETRIDSTGKLQLMDQFFEVEAGLILMATGQSKLETLLKGVSGVAFEGGKLVVDAKSGRTGNSKIYAGGDLANGGMEVVNAVAEGKRAALGMLEILGTAKEVG